MNIGERFAVEAMLGLSSRRITPTTAFSHLSSPHAFTNRAQQPASSPSTPCKRPSAMKLSRLLSDSPPPYTLYETQLPPINRCLVEAVTPPRAELPPLSSLTLSSSSSSTNTAPVYRIAGAEGVHSSRVEPTAFHGSSRPRTGGELGASSGASVVKPAMKRAYKKYYSNPNPSSHCHVCARTSKAVKFAVCARIREGLCRKVTCYKCFVKFNWDWEKAANDKNWVCVHCRGECPEGRSQCFIYSRVNRKRVSKRKTERLKAFSANAMKVERLVK